MVGDSITRGFDCSSTDADTVYNGYRGILDTLAIADGYTSLQWKGTQNNSTASYVPTRLHDGINGDSCNDKLPGAPTLNHAGYPTSPVTNIFGAGKPAHGVGVVLLNLGTNAENGGSGYAADYKATIELIHSLEPQARFVVNTIFSGSAVAANNTALTTSVTGVWDQLEREGILLYRASTTLVGGDLCDGIHPTSPGGYTKLAGNIYPALRRALGGS